MHPLFLVIASTLLAGLAMPIGAAFASREQFKPEWLEKEFRHGVMAFGGGALLSAVALVLVPEGITRFKPWSASLFFIAGGLSFMFVDIILKKIDTAASQLTAMLSDFIPESIALGAAFATGKSSVFVLAGLIALQNLPEGFNAYCELKASSSYSSRTIVLIFAVMALLGPLVGVSGYLWLQDNPAIVAAIMLFASGGILYSIFQDIAPQAKLETYWAPPMGAVLGFVLGMAGFMMTP
ncbi:ZIP family metal transporter [Desulfoplanes formicivorans]|uniref:Divalent cation transporter n=1 Tax=Desulfoplanes formicivorans TaxID=1592317 RepID=A0A194AD17_9BACT|nr:divalent cation transporter [Desulfoplanes formicivorans]GAU07997.1 divalent cation transporter [Desulfoplanes formicivorans]